MPIIQQQAEAGQCQQYNDRQKQVSARNTTTGRSRSRQQYNNYQEQVCCADCLPSGAHHRHSCTRPIQQHTGICQYTTSYHSAEQRRARKGGARGGKAGFVTPSAFPPRKPAHAKVSPRKGNPTAKESPRKGNLPTPKCPPWKGKALRQERPSDARHCTISGTIFSLFLSIIQLHVYYKEHTSKLLTLNPESVILWSS